MSIFKRWPSLTLFLHTALLQAVKRHIQTLFIIQFPSYVIHIVIEMDIEFQTENSKLLLLNGLGAL